MECHLPPVSEARLDRASFVAVRGERQPSRSCPPLDDQPWGYVPELALVAAEETHPQEPRGLLSRMWRSLGARRS